MKNQPTLSILIPTRNREKYALNVVQNILDIPDQRFQLVIQDNSDTNNLEHLLAIYHEDARLVYNYSPEVLSFVDNFSKGISHCAGEYVTIIGDDDSINPEIIAFTVLASQFNIDAITPSLPAFYFWPDSGVNMANANGTLNIDDFSGACTYTDTKKELIKYLKNGCHNYLDYNLAKAYHGIVKRSLLEQIKEKTGSFVGGLSPDIYLSVAISLLINKVMVVDYPLTISGICNRSGSSDSATGKHTGELKHAPHFKGHDQYEWAEIVPAFYSVDTIWADSALAAIKEMHAGEYLKYFNVKVLAAYCLKAYPEYKSMIESTLEKHFHLSRNALRFKINLLKTRMLTEASVFKSRIIKKKSWIIQKLKGNTKTKVMNQVADIKMATKLTTEFIENKYKVLLFNFMKQK